MKIRKLLIFFVVLVFVSILFVSINNENLAMKGSAQCTCIVNISSPQNGSVFVNPEITVSGYAEEECGIEYLDYTHEWENGSDNNSWSIETPISFYEFEFSITLHEGLNSINVSARGACGATGFDEIVIFYFQDTEPPNINIEYPINGSTITDTIIDVIGNASDNFGIASWGYIHTSNEGKIVQVFPLEVPQKEIQIEIINLELAEGYNVIEIFVVDEAENNESEKIELTVTIPEEGLLIESVFQPVQVVYQSDPLYGNDLEDGPCIWNAKLGMVAGKNTYLFGYPYNERNEIKIKVHNNYSSPKTFSFVFKIYPDNKEIWRSNPVTIPAKTKMTFTYSAPLPANPFQWERWGDSPKIKDGSIVLSLDPDPTKPPADYRCENVTVKVKIYYTHDLKVLFVPFTFSNGPDFPDDLKIPRNGGTNFDRWRWNSLEPWWLAIYPLREGGLFTARSWLGNLKKDITVDGTRVNSLATYNALTPNQRYRVRLQLYRATAAASWMTLYDRIVFLVHPDILQGANGMAIMSRANGNSKQGVIVNWSQRSKTAVHEVSHTYGLDESYTAGTPYKAVGYWVNKKEDVLNSENNKDLMWRTYPIWEATQKSWIKKPNFKILLQRFNQHRDPEVIGIVGMIDKNDSITLYPWYKIDGYVDKEWGEYGDYTIKAYDKNGGIINETGFNITFILNIGDTGGIEINETIFAFRLEWLNNISRIEIINTSSGEILAVRNVSENMPQVSIISPSNEVSRGICNITWNAFDSDGDEMWFNLFISEDNEGWYPLAIEIQNTTFTANFSLLAEGVYKIKVIATDGINTGSDVSQFSIINIPPTVEITSPFNSETVSGNVTIKGTADDLDGTIAKVEVRINGKEWQIVNGTTSWEFIWNTKNVSNGNYTIEARSYDGEKYSNITSIAVKVLNNHPPMVTITSPANGTNVSGVINITGISSDADGNHTIQKVEIKINDEKWEIANGTTNWLFVLDTTSLKNGEHSIFARAYDGEDYSEMVKITINVQNEAKKKGISGFEFILFVVAMTIISISAFISARKSGRHK